MKKHIENFIHFLERMKHEHLQMLLEEIHSSKIDGLLYSYCMNICRSMAIEEKRQEYMYDDTRLKVMPELQNEIVILCCRKGVSMQDSINTIAA